MQQGWNPYAGYAPQPQHYAAQGQPGMDPYYQQHYQQSMQQSQVYGTYGHQLAQNAYQANAWQSLAFRSEDEFAAMFQQYCSPTLGGVQAQELCNILNTHPQIRNYYRINWTQELCKVMIAMLDRSRDGIMQYAEFRELLQCLTYWHQVFCEFDANRSGYIESNELANIIRNRFGYILSVQSMTTLLKRYSRAMDNGRTLVAFDDFVVLCVRLRAYTEAFRARDRQQQGRETGNCTFAYDDFIQCVLCL